MWKPRSNPNVDPRHKLPLASPPRVRVPTAMPILVGVWHKTGCCFKFARNVWSECSFLVGSRGTQCTYLFFVVTPCSSCQQHLGGKRTIWLLHVVNMGVFFLSLRRKSDNKSNILPPPKKSKTFMVLEILGFCSKCLCLLSFFLPSPVTQEVKLSWSLKFWVFFAQNVYVSCLFFLFSPVSQEVKLSWSLKFGGFLLKMSMFVILLLPSLSHKKSNFHGPWNLVVFCSKCLCLLSYYSPLCPTRSQTFMVLEIWWFFPQNVYVCCLFFSPTLSPKKSNFSWSLKFRGFFAQNVHVFSPVHRYYADYLRSHPEPGAPVPEEPENAWQEAAEAMATAASDSGALVGVIITFLSVSQSGETTTTTKRVSGWVHFWHVSNIVACL